MLGKWRATQSNQDSLCQSFIENLKEDKQGKRLPKDFCESLIGDLQKLCYVEKGITYVLTPVHQSHILSI